MSLAKVAELRVTVTGTTPPMCWTAVFDLYFLLVPNWNWTVAAPAFGVTEAVTVAPVAVTDFARPVVAVGGATS